MASQARVIFSSQAVAVATPGASTWTPLHGVQSVGMDTNFNTEQVFELSNQSIYENIEGSPDVQVNMSKVFDGYCPLLLAFSQGASSAALVARAAQISMFGLAIHDSTVTAATGVPLRECRVSGTVIGSWGAEFNADGNFLENITLQATDKIFYTGGLQLINFTEFNNDVPRSLYGSGGVNRREDILYDSTVLYTGVNIGLDSNGQVNTTDVTILPPDIDGVGSSGLVTRQSDGSWSAHVQSLGVSVDFGREEIFELGSKKYYARFANPLTQVTTTITTLGISGDGISVNDVGFQGNGNNTRDRTIKIRLREGLLVDLGLRNRISNVTYGGGDAGGGNVSITYTYANFNDCTVKHPSDLTTALRIPGPAR